MNQKIRTVVSNPRACGRSVKLCAKLVLTLLWTVPLMRGLIGVILSKRQPAHNTQLTSLDSELDTETDQHTCNLTFSSRQL